MSLLTTQLPRSTVKDANILAFLGEKSKLETKIDRAIYTSWLKTLFDVHTVLLVKQVSNFSVK